MKNILLIIIVISSLSCTSDNKKENMGIFDKLFGKKELKSKPKEPEQNSEKLMDSDSFGKL